MEIARIDPGDADTVAAAVAVRNAVNAHDAPWLPPNTLRSTTADLTVGWDGEPSFGWLGTEDGAPVAFGTVGISEHDNRHLAWLGVRIHPEHRRRGLGTQLLEALVAEARALGRTTFGADGWDSEWSAGFAARHGFEPASRSINRRQVLADVDWAGLTRHYDDALARAASYELVRRAGRTPDEELDALAVMASAINDAPTDDLDLEDEVYTGERMRGYEHAQEVRGNRLYRVLARHRESGELAGQTVVVVEGDDPTQGHQHDTSVVGSHRGHRLGVLLKADMNQWLRQVEPRLERIDTWNAESNDHMVGVNELLGYRVLGRGIEYQRKD